MTLTPTRDDADKFVLILSTGMPSWQAIQYFAEEGTTKDQLQDLHNRWIRSKAVADAIKRSQGKSWEEMTLHERMTKAIDKQYTEMAYFLCANNYNDLTGADRAKADTCRAALEAKVAGLAGKMDALSRFFDDVVANRVKMPAVPQPIVMQPVANA